MKDKKIFLFLAISFAVVGSLFIAKSVSAQTLPAATPQDEFPLEVVYPDIPDNPNTITPTTIESTPLAKYAEYVFYFLVWGSGILALLVLVYAGFLYITAVGNPDKLKNARDMILSALLGLAIVGGCYIILAKINPHFLVFDLPDIEPLINTLSPGVLACKSDTPEVEAAWIIQQTYMLGYLHPAILAQPGWNYQIGMWINSGFNLNNISSDANIKKMAVEWLDGFLKKINSNCYYVNTAGNVRPDFNDKIKMIYFIPDIKYRTTDDGRLTLSDELKYGAAIFSDNNYQGIGQIYASHMTSSMGWSINPFLIDRRAPQLNVSSIKPFKTKPAPEDLAINWRVRLYEGIEKNKGLPNQEVPFFDKMALPTLFDYFGWQDNGFIPRPIVNSDNKEISPASMIVDGSPMIALFKDALTVNSDGSYGLTDPVKTSEGRGYYLQIFFSSDNNLEDENMLIKWIECPNYTEDNRIRDCSVANPNYLPGSWAPATIQGKCCAKAAADGIAIFGNIMGL